MPNGKPDAFDLEDKAAKRAAGSKIAKAVALKGSEPTPTIEKKNPQMAVEILEGLARGATGRQLAAKYQIDLGTIQRMARRHRETITDVKELIAGHAYMDLQRGRAILNQKWDMMEDDPEQIAKTNVRDLVQSVSMLGEGYMAAIGENKVVIEHRTGPSVSDAQAAILLAKERAKAKIEEAKRNAIDV